MKISVERFVSDEETTLSLVLVDGVFQCFGLEDEHRDIKVPGETRIPAGYYRIGVRTHGGFHNRYAGKFADIHQGMLEIKDVHGFTDVLIHVGNIDDDTAGCLLVGEGASSPARGEKSIQGSVRGYRALYSEVISAALTGDLTIEFIDRDRAAEDGA